MSTADRTFELGDATQDETMVVSLCLGALLGAWQALLDVFSVSDTSATEVLLQLFALKAFGLLSAFGMLTLAAYEVVRRRSDIWGERLWRLAGPPIRVSLTLCYGASGAAIGAAVPAAVIFRLLGTEPQVTGALLALGAGVLLLMWGFAISIMAATVGGMLSRSMAIVGALFAITLVILLFVFKRDGFWLMVALVVIGVVCVLCYRKKDGKPLWPSGPALIRWARKGLAAVRRSAAWWAGRRPDGGAPGSP